MITYIPCHCGFYDHTRHHPRVGGGKCENPGPKDSLAILTRDECRALMIFSGNISNDIAEDFFPSFDEYWEAKMSAEAKICRGADIKLERGAAEVSDE